MTRVIVLGGSGMLGSMVAGVLARDPALSVTATARAGVADGGAFVPGIDWRRCDLQPDDPRSLEVVDGHEWIVNAVGITKPFIRDDEADEVERAVRINSVLPHRLAERAARGGARLLQIATDCVYSGMRGGYREADAHDALDVYGKTKSLGEVRRAGAHHLRCSIVGPEAGRPRYLLEWFRGQARGATVKGFTNHRWNGVTTLHFARVVQGVIRAGMELPSLHHLVPRDVVTKAELLRLFARAFDRADVTVEDREAPETVDRVLGTADPALNARLWQAAGYAEPPRVADMVLELAAHRRETAS